MIPFDRARRAIVAWLAVLAFGVVVAPFAHGGPIHAPPFKAKDVTGGTVDLDQLRRRGPVLLDFWATWCKPCIEALPEYERWHRLHGPRGLTVIGVSVDGPRNYSKVRPFAQRLGLTFPIVLDQDERIRHLYRVLAVPTTVLVDSAGMVVASTVGFRPGEEDTLERQIEKLLGSAASAADSSTTPAEP